jgi:Abi-like protein
MSTNKIPKLDNNSINTIFSTLTSSRLTKYLSSTKNDIYSAIRLYTINSTVSSSLMVDIHYLEIALRNKFDLQLSVLFGYNWFSNNTFLSLLDSYNKKLLKKAVSKASKNLPAGALPYPGKVIAEITFGFWVYLTNSQFEHSLWVPALHKSFSSSKPPKRSVFNSNLDRLRTLRNRIAHHEPIYHWDLIGEFDRVNQLLHLLCPTTAFLMRSTTHTKRHVMCLTKYRKRRF